jgi:hypothetical protein
MREMILIKHGKFYVFKREEWENDDIVIHRCWGILNLIQTSDIDIQLAESQVRKRLNVKYFKCNYTASSNN